MESDMSKDAIWVHGDLHMKIVSKYGSCLYVTHKQ